MDGLGTVRCAPRLVVVEWKTTRCALSHLAEFQTSTVFNRDFDFHCSICYNYFHDFKRPVEYATMKIEILIENGRSLKLRQT